MMTDLNLAGSALSEAIAYYHAGRPDLAEVALAEAEHRYRQCETERLCRDLTEEPEERQMA